MITGDNFSGHVKKNLREPLCLPIWTLKVFYIFGDVITARLFNSFSPYVKSIFPI